MSDRVVTPSAATAVTLAELKGHLAVTWDDSDSTLTTYLKAAHNGVEAATSRALVTQTRCVDLPTWPVGGAIGTSFMLPRPPLASVSHVKYYDETNTLRTLVSSKYLVTAKAILWLDAFDAPALFKRPDAVQITYVAGTAAESVDSILKSAILLWAENLFRGQDDNRQRAIDAIIAMHVVHSPEARQFV